MLSNFAKIWYDGTLQASQLKWRKIGGTGCLSWHCSTNYHLFSFTFLSFFCITYTMHNFITQFQWAASQSGGHFHPALVFAYCALCANSTKQIY